MEIENFSGVKTVINRLDERYRAVFLLYEVEGYSHQEIAEILDVGVSTSRTMLTRAKNQLRKMLAE
jgi:RNA polymerase sigma-70 factor (ECF subfamily)